MSWAVTTLGEACRFIDYRGRTPEKVSAGLRLITAKNVKMGVLLRKPVEFVDPQTYESWMTRGIPRIGDVLFTTEAPLANVAQLDTDERVVFAQRIIVLQPRTQELDGTFLKYLLLSDPIQQRIREKATGATVKGIKASLLKNIEIGFPPVSEQRRIVETLDTTFAATAIAKTNADANVRNSRELYENYLNTFFAHHGSGWVEVRLGDIARTQYGLSEPMNEEGRGFKTFRMGEVQDGRLIDTGRMKRTEIDRAEFEKYKLRQGDVLFNRTNSYELVGKTGIFSLEGDYCFASYLVRVLPDTTVMLPQFLNYLMNSASFQASVKKKASRSINQANINATILSNESVWFPVSLSVQRSIVSQLEVLRDQTQRLSAVYEQKIRAVDQLKQSLLNSTLRGAS